MHQRMFYPATVVLFAVAQQRMRKHGTRIGEAGQRTLQSPQSKFAELGWAVIMLPVHTPLATPRDKMPGKAAHQ